MRISYGLITQLAREGDMQAMNVMTQWEKLGNPQSPTMKTEAHFRRTTGLYLHTPEGSAPRRPTMQGMPGARIPMRPRSATLMGMQAPAVLEIIITDNDGDPDGDE